MVEVKANLDLVSCVFEFEGDAAFVKEELRELRELIREGLIPISASEKEIEGIPNDSNQGMDDGAVEMAQQPETASKGKKPKPKNTRTPKVLPLDLTGGGNNSLKDFAEKKGPKNDIEKYEVIAYWLKKQLQIDEVGNDHMFTCLKALGWRVPREVGVALRNAKMSHASFDLGSTKGLYRLNHIGENRVEYDLPAKSK